MARSYNSRSAGVHVWPWLLRASASVSSADRSSIRSVCRFSSRRRIAIGRLLNSLRVTWTHNKAVEPTAAPPFRFDGFWFFIRSFCRPSRLSAAVAHLGCSAHSSQEAFEFRRPAVLAVPPDDYERPLVQRALDTFGVADPFVPPAFARHAPNHALERMTASLVIRRLDVFGSGHRSAWSLGRIRRVQVFANGFRFRGTFEHRHCARLHPHQIRPPACWLATSAFPFAAVLHSCTSPFHGQRLYSQRGTRTNHPVLGILA